MKTKHMWLFYINQLACSPKQTLQIMQFKIYLKCVKLKIKYKS